MILASKDSLFLVNNALFFTRFGYNVKNANDYFHAINNIKTLAETNEKINILVVKSRLFNDEDESQLHRILDIDKEILIVVLSNKKGTDEENVHVLDYYSSPMEIIDNLGKN
jgi:hypothetical protein